MVVIALILTLVAGSVAALVATAIAPVVVGIPLLFLPVAARMNIGSIITAAGIGFLYAVIAYYVFGWLVGPMPVWAPAPGLMMVIVYAGGKSRRDAMRHIYDNADPESRKQLESVLPVPSWKLSAAGVLVGLLYGAYHFSRLAEK